MAITAKRWGIGCVLACLVLAVMLLPPQPNDDPFYQWTPRWSVREEVLTTRVQNRHIHGNLLWLAYRHARDEELAQREFGGKPSSAGGSAAMSVWYDTDVPAATRRAVSTLLGADESSRGTWRDKGGVGVLVLTDTATTIDRIRLPWGFNSGLIVSTKVLPPTRTTGDRCVAVIRVGRLALTGGGTIPADRSLLDGCAFYDAFGKPGPQVAAWLDSTNLSFARSLSFAPPDSITLNLSKWGYENYIYGDVRFTRCAAGDFSACTAMLSDRGTSIYWRFWHDNSVPIPAEGQEITQRGRGFSATLLDAMVRDIGPERFERVWQSPKALDVAYFDVTGEQLAAWIHGRAVAVDGPYHIGPLPTATSGVLTIITIVLSLALAVRLARRPAAA